MSYFKLNSKLFVSEYIPISLKLTNMIYLLIFFRKEFFLDISSLNSNNLIKYIGLFFCSSFFNIILLSITLHPVNPSFIFIK